MSITVILCTYNRSQILGKTLESLAFLSLPPSVEWEVLVVDNNSTDRTSEVVQELSRRFPGRFRYLREPRAGKSNALNAAIKEAQSDILAFTDDDVTVEPDWLQNLTSCLSDPTWAGAAGRTLPQASISIPQWLSRGDRHALAPLAIFDRGSCARELTEAPFGNNMAYRKAVFEKYGLFRTDLGPRPGASGPQKNEDSEFGVRLLAAGERLRYEPTAVLYHLVPETRVRREYFLAWWFDQARADIRAFGFPTETKWVIAGIPLYLFRRLAAWSAIWLFSVRPSRRFSCKVNVWVTMGEIKECYRLWSEGRSTQTHSSKQAD